MEITLYSTHCPKCVVLEKKLQAANISYTVNSNEEDIVATGYMSLPLLKVNDTIYEFKEACDWVGELCK